MAGIMQYVARHSPKQSEIVEAIRMQILSGDMPRGAQLPPVTELAGLHKASTRTVQNAMHHLKRAGYIQSSKGVGNYVSDSPPHLCHFGLIIGQGKQQFFSAWEQQVHLFNRAKPGPEGLKRRISVFRDPDGPNVTDYGKLVAAVQQHTIGGLIFTLPPYRFKGTPVLDEPHLPRVAIQPWPEKGLVAVVLGDFTDKALGYIAARGRKRVGLIVHSAYESGDFCERMIASASRYGLTCRRHWMQGVFLTTPTWAANSAESILRGPEADRPDALLIMDDNLVPYAIDGVLATGLRVPEDLDVVAHCNFPYITGGDLRIKHIGYHIPKLLDFCMDLIGRQQRREELPGMVSFPAHLDDELQRLGTEP